MVGLRDVGFLIIDDNPHMRTIVETIVRAFGARDILLASTEIEAMDLLIRKPRDIMICDYVLGTYTICDFVREVRNAPVGEIRFMPVILLTAHTSLGRIAAARDAGVSNVCQKPISATALFKRLAAVIDNPVPFVIAETYVGPDRRRMSSPPYDGPERRNIMNSVNAALQAPLRQRSG